MPQFCPNFAQKKRVFGLPRSDFPGSLCHLDGASEIHEPSAGPPEAKGPHDGPPKAHGPPKVNGPLGHCTPLLPLSEIL